MSKLTSCNYCNLRWLRREAREEGKVCTTRPGPTLVCGTYGTDVLIHDASEEALNTPTSNLGHDHEQCSPTALHWIELHDIADVDLLRFDFFRCRHVGTPDREKHFAAWLMEVTDHCVC